MPEHTIDRRSILKKAAAAAVAITGSTSVVAANQDPYDTECEQLAKCEFGDTFYDSIGSPGIVRNEQSTVITFYGAEYNAADGGKEGTWDYHFRLLSTNAARGEDGYGNLTKAEVIDKHYFDITSERGDTILSGGGVDQYRGIYPGGANGQSYANVFETVMKTSLGLLGPQVSFAIAAADIVGELKNPDQPSEGSGIDLNVEYSQDYIPILGQQSDVVHVQEFFAKKTATGPDALSRDFLNITSGTKSGARDTEVSVQYELSVSGSEPELQSVGTSTMNPYEMTKERRKELGIKKIPAHKSTVLKAEPGVDHTKNKFIYRMEKKPKLVNSTKKN